MAASAWKSKSEWDCGHAPEIYPTGLERREETWSIPGVKATGFRLAMKYVRSGKQKGSTFQYKRRSGERP